ncbi:hypothetical protein AB0E08_07755 [Streptomyces sp. NPDC048281]|uniref:hypothetical protein n=1 Tax=Streptomyces sp. NPDC048281 TaxID=3154715 RepID=UPI0034267E64
MAGLTIDDSEPMPDEADTSDPKCPFRGDSQRFTWSRQLEIGQLQDEITSALGPAVQLAAFFPLDGDGDPLAVDAQNPITLYVTPSSADLAAVKQVLAVHKPDPYYGMTDEQKTQAQLREKIASGQPLTPEETTAALQMLIAG